MDSMPSGSGRMIVGAKQVMRALRGEQIAKVYIAQDAQAAITSPVVTLCNQLCISVEHVETMQKLGQTCGIDVGASVAGALLQKEAE